MTVERRIAVLSVALLLLFVTWLAVTNLGVSRPPALATACRQNLKNIHLALTMYHQDQGAWPTTLDDTEVEDFTEGRLVCPCSHSTSRDSGYCYRAPQNSEVNEPLAWDDAPRHSGQIQMVWEDCSTTRVPSEPSYLEPNPPAINLAGLVGGASFCSALILVACGLGFPAKPTKVSLCIVLALFAVGIVLSLLPRVPYARVRHSQKDLKTIWLALRELRGERGSWPRSLAAVQESVPSSVIEQLPSKRRMSRYDYRPPEGTARNEAIAWEHDDRHYGRRHVLYEDGTIMLLPRTTGRPRDFDSVLNESHEHVTSNRHAVLGRYGAVSEQCTPGRGPAGPRTNRSKGTPPTRRP